jgi:hypothetical protein
MLNAGQYVYEKSMKYCWKGNNNLSCIKCCWIPNIMFGQEIWNPIERALIFLGREVPVHTFLLPKDKIIYRIISRRTGF